MDVPGLIVNNSLVNVFPKKKNCSFSEITFSFPLTSLRPRNVITNNQIAINCFSKLPFGLATFFCVKYLVSLRNTSHYGSKVGCEQQFIDFKFICQMLFHIPWN